MTEYYINSNLTKNDLITKGFNVYKENPDDYAYVIKFNNHTGYIVINDFDCCFSIRATADYKELINDLYDNFPDLQMIDDASYEFAIRQFNTLLNYFQNEFKRINYSSSIEPLIPDLNTNSNNADGMLMDQESALFGI